MTAAAGERLSRARLLEVGARLIDARGIEALSMRTLAAELGVSRGAMYRHFANKQEFLEGLADDLYGSIEVDDLPGLPWTQLLVELCERLQAMHTRHPWVADVMQHREFRDPHETAHVARLTACVVGALRQAGFPEREVELATALWAAYITGAQIQSRLRERGLPSPTGRSRLRPGDYDAYGAAVLVAGLRARLAELDAPTRR